MKRTTKEGRGNTQLSRNEQLKRANIVMANQESIIHRQGKIIQNLEEVIGFIDMIHFINKEEDAVDILTNFEISLLPKEDDEEE
jgi:hypothetical protein